MSSQLQVLQTLTDSSLRLVLTSGVSLLMVDDDAELCELAQEFLEQQGIQIAFVNDGPHALAILKEQSFDLLVLDVMLPEMDGFSVLRQMRQEENQTPVLMLTACSDAASRVAGLELGADDYLAKPFEPFELVARIRAILRRTRRGQEPAPFLEVNGIRLSFENRQAYSDSQPVELTTTEFDILELLMRSAGKVVSRDDLMAGLYQREASPFDRSIDVHVCHLRRKLDGTRPLIKTIRGTGYQFCGAPMMPTPINS